MDQVRCVIANMPRNLLADIVENIVAESGRIQVVDRVDSLSEIKGVIDQEPVDLLVLGMQGVDLPQTCLGIMNEIPDLAIVGLIDEGRRLACFLDNVGRNDILKVIHTFSRREPESRQ